MTAIRLLAFFALASASCTPLLAAPRFGSNGSGQITSVSGLNTDKDCHPMRLEGRVVRRQFQENEIRMNGVVLEDEDGSRSFVNIEVPWDDLDMLRLNGITRGLQTLLKVGRQVTVDIRACGAAGRVMMLDAVR